MVAADGSGSIHGICVGAGSKMSTAPSYQLGRRFRDDSSVGGCGKIIISSNNVGRWRQTEAAVTTEAEVELAGRRKRRLGTSLNGFLTDGGSVDSSSGITVSSNNGGR